MKDRGYEAFLSLLEKKPGRKFMKRLWMIFLLVGFVSLPVVGQTGKPKTEQKLLKLQREWLDASKGGKVKPGGNFEFSGMVTETLLLGDLAVRAGQRLDWDRANLRVLNSEGAQKMIAPERRKGWEL